MNITQAKKLSLGEIVHCPADRGEAGYTGKVYHISEEVNKTFDGKSEYVWVTVEKTSGKTRHVWPSNRLG